MISNTARQKRTRKQKLVELAKAPFAEIDLEKEFTDLVKSIRFSAFKVGIGLAGGTGLIILRHYWHHMTGDAVLGVVGEHVGMGLIVASVAVFGYEWRSQSKEAMDLSKQLTVSIDEVKQLKSEAGLMEGLLNVLEMKGSAELDSALVSLLGTESNELIRDFRTLVESLFRIKNRETWMNDAYVTFIKNLFREYVVKNASELRNVNDGGTGHFTVPSAAGLTADNLLATHVEMATAGDSYDVISDIASWRDMKLRAFSEKSKDAIERGVRVRRVFNFFLHGHPNSHDASFNDTCGRTIRSLLIHKELASNSKGKYQVKFFWTEELKDFQELTDASLSVDAQHWHFGLFKRNAAPQVVTRFKVERTNLSDMEVNSNETDIREDAELFEIVWNAATPLDDALIKNLDLFLKEKILIYRENKPDNSRQ